jgi:hypothetical protein
LGAAAARSEEPRATSRKLDPDLLALCRSTDPAGRRYCLREITAHGDPDGEAKETIATMAEHDEVLREAAADAYARLYGRPPSAAPAPRPTPAEASGDPSRVIYAPTAFTRPQGASSFNAFELGTFAFEHGLTPNVTIGLQTALPIGALVIGPTVRAGIPFEGGAIGIQLQALVFAPFVGSAHALLVAGGGPMLTLGNHDRYLNLGVLGYVTSSNGSGAVIPHLGFSARVAQSVRIGAEAYLPGAYGSDVRDAGLGKVGIVVWGVRLIGARFWGDVALVDLVCDGCGELYRVLPLGIPFLNFGLGW